MLSVRSNTSKGNRTLRQKTQGNHNLEEQAQALYKSWFVDFEPFRGGGFVESELGMIPEGWRVTELGTVTRQRSQKVKDRIDVKDIKVSNDILWNDIF